MIRPSPSVVEWRSHHRGDIIAYEDNRALTSDPNDPRVEAQKWVEGLSLAAEPKQIVVIGVGSGFHLQALAEVFPFTEIIAIDCRVSLIGFARRWMRNIEYIHIEDVEQLASHFRMRELMSAQTPKVVFKPSLGSQAKFLGEIFYFLNIRTFEGLSAYLGRKVTGPDNVLLSLRQLFENIKADEIPYKISEVLTLKEIAR